MDFNEAAIIATRAVKNAPLNLSVEKFHKTIKSVVVESIEHPENFAAITVNEYRTLVDFYELIITVAGKDDFDKSIEVKTGKS